MKKILKGLIFSFIGISAAHADINNNFTSMDNRVSNSQFYVASKQTTEVNKVLTQTTKNKILTDSLSAIRKEKEYDSLKNIVAKSILDKWFNEKISGMRGSFAVPTIKHLYAKSFDVLSQHFIKFVEDGCTNPPVAAKIFITETTGEKTPLYTFFHSLFNAETMNSHAEDFIVNFKNHLKNHIIKNSKDHIYEIDEDEDEDEDEDIDLKTLHQYIYPKPKTQPTFVNRLYNKTCSAISSTYSWFTWR